MARETNFDIFPQNISQWNEKIILPRAVSFKNILPRIRLVIFTPYMLPQNVDLPVDHLIHFLREPLNQQAATPFKHFYDIGKQIENNTCAYEKRIKNNRWSAVYQRLTRPVGGRCNTDVRTSYCMDENYFLVKSKFTFGLRRVKQNEKHLIQIGSKSLSLFYMDREKALHHKICEKPDAFFCESHQHSFKWLKLECDKDYIISEGCHYIVLASQNLFFSLHIFDQDEALGLNDCIEINSVTPQVDLLYTRPVETPLYVSHVSDEESSSDEISTPVVNETFARPGAIFVRRSVIETLAGKTLAGPSKTLAGPSKTLTRPGKTLAGPGKTLTRPRIGGIFKNKIHKTPVLKFENIYQDFKKKTYSDPNQKLISKEIYEKPPEESPLNLNTKEFIEEIILDDSSEIIDLTSRPLRETSEMSTEVYCISDNTGDSNTLDCNYLNFSPSNALNEMFSNTEGFNRASTTETAAGNVTEMLFTPDSVCDTNVTAQPTLSENASDHPMFVNPVNVYETDTVNMFDDLCAFIPDSQTVVCDANIQPALTEKVPDHQLFVHSTSVSTTDTANMFDDFGGFVPDSPNGVVRDANVMVRPGLSENVPDPLFVNPMNVSNTDAANEFNDFRTIDSDAFNNVCGRFHS